ncbi:MAG: hypothetical protein AABW89_03485 [Nanoarchaeota archaeon]
MGTLYNLDDYRLLREVFGEDLIFPYGSPDQVELQRDYEKVERALKKLEGNKRGGNRESLNRLLSLIRGYISLSERKFEEEIISCTSF